MIRLRVLAVTATLAITNLPVSASAESYTTRIETRPFYGATVTLEEGVRVFRPLPPDRHVIINPGGQTPLSINETNVYERRVIHNYNHDQSGDAAPVIQGNRAAGYGVGNGIRNGEFGHGAFARSQGGVGAGRAALTHGQPSTGHIRGPISHGHQ